MKKMAYVLCTLVLWGCINRYNSNDIGNLLRSTKSNPTEIIYGAFLAGESGQKKYIPLLLKNTNDVRACGDIQFKNFNVYQEKMGALKKILKVNPPKKITRIPDSTIILFYENYYRKTNNQH